MSMPVPMRRFVAANGADAHARRGRYGTGETPTDEDMGGCIN